jgi:hypothetical protein
VPESKHHLQSSDTSNDSAKKRNGSSENGQTPIEEISCALETKSDEEIPVPGSQKVISDLETDNDGRRCSNNIPFSLCDCSEQDGRIQGIECKNGKLKKQKGSR